MKIINSLTPTAAATSKQRSSGNSEFQIGSTTCRNILEFQIHLVEDSNEAQYAL